MGGRVLERQDSRNGCISVLRAIDLSLSDFEAQTDKSRLDPGYLRTSRSGHKMEGFFLKAAFQALVHIFRLVCE